MARAPEGVLRARGLRVVRTGEQGPGADLTMAEALADLAARAAAERPAVALLVWELSDGTLRIASLPASPSVTKGLAAAAYDLLHPDSGDAA